MFQYRGRIKFDTGRSTYVFSRVTILCIDVDLLPFRWNKVYQIVTPIPRIITVIWIERILLIIDSNAKTNYAMKIS